MKLLFTSIAILLSLPVLSSPEIKGNPEELQSYFHPQEKTLTIRDFAEETAYTDEAIVNLVVKTEDKLLSNALKSNSKLRREITQELVDKGIQAANIQNSKFSSSPQYGWFGSKPDSYEVANRVAITIASEKHLENIAALADAHEEITLSGTKFKHSKEEEYKQKVKQKALDKVLTKKRFYENALNVRLTAISFSEANVDFRATEGSDMLEEVIVRGLRASKGKLHSKQNEFAEPRQNSFDEVKYNASIAVEFKVQQKK